MLKKLSLIMVVFIVAMSCTVATVSVQAEEKVAGRAYIASFDDGSYAQVLGGEGSEDVVITDKISEEEGGKSLCWTKKDGNSSTILFPDKGVQNLPGKKTLHIRAYGENANGSSNVSRMDIVVYNRTGSGEYTWGSYPINGNAWTTIDIPFSKLSFWSDTAPTAIRFKANGAYANGDKLYIDSVWVEYAEQSTFTEKNFSGSKTVFDFNISARGAHGTDINSHIGIDFGWTQDKDFDSSYSVKCNAKGSNNNNASALFMRCLNSTSETHYHEQMNWNEYDNVVFRMKAVPNGETSLESGRIYIGFSSGYASNINGVKPNIAPTQTVAFDRWCDYKIPISEINAAFPDNIRTIVITGADATYNDFSILLDRIFLTKDAPATLSAPLVELGESNVNTYLEDNSTVKFTFAENLMPYNYASGITVRKNGAISDEAFVTNVNENVLSVSFADALSAESDYEIVLDKNWFRGESGNAMAEDKVYSFRTCKAKYAIESVNVVNDDDGIKAVAVVSNNTDSMKTSELILAAYRGNEFVALTTTSLSKSAVSGGSVEAAFDEETELDGCTFKAFVWDSVAGLKPVIIGK